MALNGGDDKQNRTLAYATPTQPRPIPAWLWMTAWLAIMAAMIFAGFIIIVWLELRSGFGP